MPEFTQLEREERQPGRTDEWWNSPYSWKELSSRRIPDWVIEGDGGDARFVHSASRSDGADEPSQDRRQANLQDYFRWDGAKFRTDKELTEEGILETLRDEVFHILHVPMESRSGRPLWKSAPEAERWETVETIVTDLIARTMTQAGLEAASRSFPAALLLNGTTLNFLDIVGSAGVKNVGYQPSKEAQDEISSARKAGQPFDLKDPSETSIEGPLLEFIVLRDTHVIGGMRLKRARSKVLSIRYSTIDGPLTISDSAMEMAGRLSMTRVDGELRIERCFVGGTADFNNCNIERAVFFSCTLMGPLKLAALDTQYLSFRSCDVVGEFSFERSPPIGRFWCYGNVFRQETDLSGLEVGSMSVGSSIFAKKTEISVTCQERFYFAGLSVLGELKFLSCKFKDAAYFDNSFFFAGCHFDGSEFTQSASFSKCSFWCETSFDTVHFLSHAFFHHARFHPTELGDEADRQTTFYQTRFDESASFEGAHFHESVAFDRASFGGFADFGRQPPSWHNNHNGIKGACFDKRMSFRSAEFLNNADFAACRFPSKVLDRSSAFFGTRFREPLDLQGVDVLPFSAFHGARLENGILLDTKHPNDNQFESALQETKEAVKTDKQLERKYKKEKRKDPDEGRRHEDNRFGALEGGCRVLKLAHGDAGDYQREQQFFRYELRARRQRPSKGLFFKSERSVSSLEKNLSRLYGVTSNYGAAMFKPLGWVLMSALLSAVLYWLIGYGVGVQGQAETSQPALTLAANINTGLGSAETWLQARAEPAGLHWQQVFPLEFDEAEHAQFRQQFSHGGDALDLAFHNVFRPFGVWWPNFAGETQPWLHNLKEGLGNWGWVGLRVFASLQSIFSIAMLFLSGLALRRKFQISGS